MEFPARLRSRRVWTVALAGVLSGCLGSHQGTAESVLPGVGAAPPSDGSGAAQRGAPLRKRSQGGDLLYVDSGFTGDEKVRGRVVILTYPGYSVVSEFTVAKSGKPPATTAGMCTDANGNVFIEAVYYGGSSIFEYSHGGSAPVASLAVGSYIYATDCARDQSTGNLAVTSYGEGSSHSGNVAIFTNAMGSPQYYTDPGMYVYASCTYDGAGDLFVEGYNHSGVTYIAELARGRNKFTKMSLDTTLQHTGALQWVGNDLSVQDGDLLYTVGVSGSSGTVLHTTTLSGESGGGFAYIAGKNTIAPDYKKVDHRAMGVWRYPKGGKPLAKFEAGNLKKAFSEVVSSGTR